MHIKIDKNDIGKLRDAPFKTQMAFLAPPNTSSNAPSQQYFRKLNSLNAYLNVSVLNDHSMHSYFLIETINVTKSCRFQYHAFILNKCRMGLLFKPSQKTLKKTLRI